MSTFEPFAPAAYLAESEAAGALAARGEGGGDVIPLPGGMVEKWRVLIEYARDQNVFVPVPAVAIPADNLAVAEKNRASELGRTLRAVFCTAEGGDGTAGWISVQAADPEKGRPSMRVEVKPHVVMRSTAGKRLLAEGKVNEQGYYLTAPAEQPAPAAPAA